MSLVRRNIKRALDDRKLGRAVLNSCLLSTEKRDRLISELDFQSTRAAARLIRQRSLDENRPLLERFKESFEKAGGRLHYALTAEAACRIVVDILLKAGALQGVKAKSMVTEEIGLGQALHRAGIDAVESDLGEYIIQLAGERPSHITAPALHRSKESIGRLFADRLKIPYTDDPQQLTEIARSVLRRRYIDAEFGVSGANFLVAETGHVVVVENEGNGRLGASLPRIFVAVTGIEKVVGGLSDLAPLLALLARSATGQRATAYVNALLPAPDVSDAPDEFHLVLVDNGRRRTMADPDFAEMLLCIRCGACLNVCPVYRSVGGHAYGSVYPGPMGAVLSNLLGPRMMMHHELPFLSTLCGACKEVCPVDMDLPGMLLKLRERAPKPAIDRVAAAGWGWAMATPARMELAGRTVRTIGRAIGAMPAGSTVKTGMSFRGLSREASDK